MALVLGISAGWLMAVWIGRWPYRVMQVVVLPFFLKPGFWIGLMAIVLFSVKLGRLRSNGSLTVEANLSGGRW